MPLCSTAAKTYSSIQFLMIIIIDRWVVDRFSIKTVRVFSGFAVRHFGKSLSYQLVRYHNVVFRLDWAAADAAKKWPDPKVEKQGRPGESGAGAEMDSRALWMRSRVVRIQRLTGRRLQVRRRSKGPDLPVPAAAVSWAEEGVAESPRNSARGRPPSASPTGGNGPAVPPAPVFARAGRGPGRSRQD